MKWDQMAQKLSYKSKVFFKKNGATILTVTGAVGLVATTVTAVKATPKVIALLEEAKEEKQLDLTVLEKVKIAGPHYIPTILLGTSSIICMFGANALNKRQQAALTSAYALLDNSYKNYKKKVEELYGEDANTTISKELAKDLYDTEPEIVVVEGDDVKLFYDEYSKRYFEASLATVLAAQYDLNRGLQLNGGVYLNDWYSKLGLEETTEGYELGWSSGVLSTMYWAYWIEFEHTPVTMDDGLECIIISMPYEPVIDFTFY